MVYFLPRRSKRRCGSNEGCKFRKLLVHLRSFMARYVQRNQLELRLESRSSETLPHVGETVFRQSGEFPIIRRTTKTGLVRRCLASNRERVHTEARDDFLLRPRRSKMDSDRVISEMADQTLVASQPAPGHRVCYIDAAPTMNVMFDQLEYLLGHD